MANVNNNSTSSGRPSTIDNLVQQIIQHPDFRQALQRSSSSEFSASPNNQTSAQTPPQTSALSLQSEAQGAVVGSVPSPAQELRRIFHRNNASAPPQFALRTTWGPAGRGTRPTFNRVNSRKRDREGRPKASTFSREVVLLRWPDDSIPRGRAKAELQRLGHVVSSFTFDKNWSARVVYEKLLSTFEVRVPSVGKITQEVK